MSKPNIALTHIELHFRENGADLTFCYGVEGKTLREAQIALAQKGDDISASELRHWLSEHSCHLDRADGPAFGAVLADGTKIEGWYRDGKRHREDAPAYITHFSDGTIVETYYLDGKLDREDGPARIIHHPDGLTVEAYYRDGKLVREERLARLSRVFGVKVYPPLLLP